MGMEGWLSLEVHLLFRAPFDHAWIPFYAVGLWACHPEGRVGKIIDRAVHKERPFSHRIFPDFPTTQVYGGRNLVYSTSDPAVFLATCMDNNCIAVHNAPPDMLPAVRSFLKLFYSRLYGIPMKWEPNGDKITWCEGLLSNHGSLVLKGLPHQPLLPDSICSTWDRWLDRWSPNCPLVL